MAQPRCVHTRPLGENRYRDLEVYYDRGGMNHWSGAVKPRGVYFASHLYRKEGGVRSWATGQKGDGYLLVTPLERYSAKALRLLQERVRAEAEMIHDILDGLRGSLADLEPLLKGASVLAPTDREVA